jgi:hypothetical protein
MGRGHRAEHFAMQKRGWRPTHKAGKKEINLMKIFIASWKS